MTPTTKKEENHNYELDYLAVKKAALIFRALNHKLRQQMLELIHESGRMTVTEIYVKLRLEQSVTSQHLAILRRAGFVETIREGKFIRYSVGYRRIDQINDCINRLLS